MATKIWESRGHSAAVYDISYLHPYIYSASGDKFVTRWHVDNGEQDKFAVKSEQASYALSVHPQTQELWIGLANGDVHVIDTVEKQETHFLQHHKSAVFSICHLSQSNFTVISDFEGNLSVWDSQSVRHQLNIPLSCGKIRHLSTSDDEKLLVVHGQDGKVRILETTSFNEVSSFFAHKDGVCCSKFLDTDKLITGGKDGHIRIWNWAKEEELKAIPAHHYAVYDLQIFEESNFFVSVSRDKTIKTWNLDGDFQAKIQANTGGHTHSVNRIIKIDGKQFVTCSDDKRIILWRIP